jgi:hypothetical protein
MAVLQPLAFAPPGHSLRVKLGALDEFAYLRNTGLALQMVILDDAGQPLARDGDSVLCVGGYPPESHIEGERVAFSAGELRVFE